MSMVKWRGNFSYRAVTPDSLKFSSPKARVDPSGSSSPLITSVCPDQSIFRGSSPDSPVITSLKTGVKPYGSLSASGCSDVQYRANFLSISSFPLGCSTDHYTTASMVIARKVGCSTGKASLYAWNSFIHEDVSSVLVDLMTDLMMNFYSSCSGLIALIVPPEVILLYGSLPRPPESCFISCSLYRSTDLVCDWFMHSISQNLDYGTLRCGMDSEYNRRHQHLCRQGEKLKFAVDSCCLDLCDCQAGCYSFLLLESLAYGVYVLMLMSFRGLQMLAPLAHGSFISLSTSNAALVQHLRCWFHLFSLDKQQADATIDFWLKYSETFTGFKDSTSSFVMLFTVAESSFLDKGHGLQELDRSRSSDDYIAAATVGALMDGFSSLYKSLLGDFVQNLTSENGLMHLIVETHIADISGLVFLLKQSLPQAFLHLLRQDYDFFRCIYVVISGRFGLLTEIPYGSLPRPPDVHFAINFNLL